jgi:riboflavin kinase / FMN adenylyltransferase
MKIIEIKYPIDYSYPIEPISLAIGFFDGLHLGHQAVIRSALQLGVEHHVTPAVMTFSPHPREVLGKTSFSGYLTPLNEKLLQLERLGIHRTYVVNFDQHFANLEKETFVTDVLLPLRVSAVSTGFNFTFGHKGAGVATDLLRLGEGYFHTEIVAPVILEQQAVSSTRIRNALTAGDIRLSNELLGRPYQIQGEVVHGDKRGRQIGFPTANIQPDQPYFLPAHGVYIVHATFNGETAYGVMNVGIRPTFHDPKARTRLEVHLFNQSPHLDLYGDTLQVEYLHYLRQEAKFNSIESLIEQIKTDRLQAIEWLRKKKLSNGEWENSVQEQSLRFR